ncbi:MAG: hypothetical protein MUF42_17735 [Cytophagaceae bacterium]|jgi:DNA-binding transcriptional MerR regulator|nr:hypothetical protein [Cytophagaceae bacterium]
MKTQSILTSQSCRWQELLNRPVLRTGDMGFAPSTMLTWEGKNLINSQRNQSKDDWRKYSALDYFWMQIMDHFRQMGSPLALITGLKAGLFEAHSSEPELSVLEKLLVDQLENPKRLFIYLFRDGFWQAYAEEHPAFHFDTIRARMNQPFTVISVTAIVDEFFSGSKALPFLNKITSLTVDQQQVLHVIRHEQYQMVKFHPRDGKTRKVQKASEVTRCIIDLLLGKDYDFAEVFHFNGKILTLRKEVQE